MPAGDPAEGELSERARALLRAFPPHDGVHRLTIEVRNRHWAAMVAELLRAYSKPT